MKRFLIVLLVITISLYGVCASAQLLASDIIGACDVSISRSGNTLNAGADITATRTIDKLGFTYLRIQEKRGDIWVTVKGIASRYTTNDVVHYCSTSYVGTSGMQYRAKAKFYAKDGDVIESRTSTTKALSIP